VSVCRVLDVMIFDGVPRLGLLALRRLRFLEQFLFSETTEELVLTDFFNLLPDLHVIGYTLDAIPFSTDSDFSDDLLDMGNALCQMDAPFTLQLRQLALYDTNQVLENVSLPELKVLELFGTIAMHPWLDGGLPKLTELYAGNMDQDTLMPVLGHVGRQLQVLLVDIPELPRLNLVLDACPNLTQLQIYTKKGPQHMSQLRPDTLKHVKSVIFHVSRGYFEPGLLLQYLSLAPELRSIDLRSVGFDEDWEALAELAEEGTCMRHLETIRIQCMARLTRHEQHHLAEARISCSINCPQLKIFSVESDSHYDPQCQVA
jgi:hypothetical protein